MALLTSVSYNVVDFAKSSLEWMAENIGKHFERARANAFDLRYGVGLFKDFGSQNACGFLRQTTGAVVKLLEQGRAEAFVRGKSGFDLSE